MTSHNLISASCSSRDSHRRPPPVPRITTTTHRSDQASLATARNTVRSPAPRSKLDASPLLKKGEQLLEMNFRKKMQRRNLSDQVKGLEMLGRAKECLGSSPRRRHSDPHLPSRRPPRGTFRGDVVHGDWKKYTNPDDDILVLIDDPPVNSVGHPRFSQGDHSGIHQGKDHLCCAERSAYLNMKPGCGPAYLDATDLRTVAKPYLKMVDPDAAPETFGCESRYSSDHPYLHVEEETGVEFILVGPEPLKGDEIHCSEVEPIIFNDGKADEVQYTIVRNVQLAHEYEKVETPRIQEDLLEFKPELPEGSKKPRRASVFQAPGCKFQECSAAKSTSFTQTECPTQILGVPTQTGRAIRTQCPKFKRRENIACSNRLHCTFEDEIPSASILKPSETVDDSNIQKNATENHPTVWPSTAVREYPSLKKIERTHNPRKGNAVKSPWIRGMRKSELKRQAAKGSGDTPRYVTSRNNWKTPAEAPARYKHPKMPERTVKVGQEPAGTGKVLLVSPRSEVSTNQESDLDLTESDANNVWTFKDVVYVH